MTSLFQVSKAWSFFECGQQKPHFNPDAPKIRPNIIGRVHTMIGAEDAQNHNLIQGMFF